MTYDYDSGKDYDDDERKKRHAIIVIVINHRH